MGRFTKVAIALTAALAVIFGLLNCDVFFLWKNQHVETVETVVPSPQKEPISIVHRVNRNDKIFQQSHQGTPIVIESHKLIFFYVPKVACTVWKQLFRRMMGYSDWNTRNPHNYKFNGLVYLNNFNLSYATEIMNSPQYTRATILRDPKDRLLSAYLDKVLNTDYASRMCCTQDQKCAKQVQTFPGFFNVTRRCTDGHWMPQSQRMEPKYRKLLNFVGHMDTMEGDAKNLLQRIGAWEVYGKSGWGVFGNESIFLSKSSVDHATSNGQEDSWSRLSQYYTPALELAVEKVYAEDYALPEFGIQKRMIDFPKE